MHADCRKSSGQELPAMSIVSGPEGAEPNPLEDESSRKRRAIGLAPQRPTAQAAPYRPPDRPRMAGRKGWTLVGLLAGLMLATLLLVLARVAGAPTAWPQVANDLVRLPGQLLPSAEAEAASATDGPPGAAANPIALDEDLQAFFEFDGVSSNLGQESRPDAYDMESDAEAGAYRMQLWPDNMAWVIVGPVCKTSHLAEVDAIVDAGAPSGHAALVGRYQDDDNFYLFSVNGFGEFEVLLMQDGTWVSVGPRLFDDAIHPAGETNTLVLYDDGESMHFEVNGKSLYQSDALSLPVGKTGFAGRAEDEPARIDFSRGQFAALPCQAP